jgi:putative transposase
LLIVCRYVERNALRAGHVRKAEEWRWCSLWRRTLGSPAMKRLLSPWPVEPPSDWLEWVNRAEADAELEFLRPCLARGAPFGSPDWCAYTASHLRLDYTVRPRGRPRR